MTAMRPLHTQRPDRSPRAALARSLLLPLIALAGCHGDPAGDPGPGASREPPEDARQLVPPELRFERRSLPEEKNAYPLFLEASRVMTALDMWDDVLLDAFQHVEEEEGSYPGGDAAKALDAHIALNERALDLVDAGLARRALELPEHWFLRDAGEPEGDLHIGQALTHLPLVRLARSKRSAAAGRMEDCARDIIALLDLGELMATSEAYLFATMVGSSCRSTARSGARWFAGLRDVPAGLAARVLDAVPSVRERETMAHLMPVEFSAYVLPSILRVPEPADLETLAGHFAGGGPASDPNRKTFVAAFVEVLKGHPRPFDRRTTIREGADFYVRLRGNLLGPWKDRDFDGGEMEEVLDLWPDELLPEAASDASSCGQTLFPPDPGDMEKARAALLRIDNPVGKLLVGRILAVGITDRTGDFELEADREATRAVLALRLHALKTGGLPGSLDALVEQGILPSVPIDPFTDGPLGYSREKGVLWSRGPDGTGSGEGANPLVWRVPGSPR